MNNLEATVIMHVIDDMDAAFEDLAIQEDSAQYGMIQKLTELICPFLTLNYDLTKTPEELAEIIEDDYPISYDRALRIAFDLMTNYSVVNAPNFDPTDIKTYKN